MINPRRNNWTLFSERNPKTYQVYKQTFYLFAIKGASAIINFLMVPLLLSYLSNEQYGIWITLASFVVWFSFFDVGLGNGLRNKLAESLAKKQREEARSYVSSAYFIISALVVILILGFLLINGLVKWEILLNDRAYSREYLARLTGILYPLFFIRFIFQIIGVVLLSDLKPASNSLLTMISDFISLISIYAISKTMATSMMAVAVATAGSYLAVYFVGSLFYYSNGYRYLLPSIKLVSKKKIKEICHLGIKFFLIQIAVILIFSSSNLLITQLFGPEMVTPYNVSFKYFSALLMIYNILITPYWSAFTDAYTRGDVMWIEQRIKKLERIARYFTFFCIVMISVSQIIIRLWTGGKVKIPFSTSLLMGIFFIINICVSPYISFLNGVGKVKIQVIYSIAIIAIYAPLAIWLSKEYNLGITAVVLSICICMLPSLYLWKKQYKKIMTGKATALWNA